MVLTTEPASQGSGRCCENLARVQEEVCPLAGMETSEWAKLKVRLALGRESSAGKEGLARVVHKLLIGQAHQGGFRAEPRVHRLSGHCRKPSEP